MASRGAGDQGLAAQLDAVEEAAALLHTKSDASFSGDLGFDFTGLAMRDFHESRPMWVTPTGRIFLEARSPLYEQARDFLVAICEPKSRPEFIHEYALDRHALFAAASMGLTGELICDALDKFSKCAVSEGVKAFVTACTSGYGKVKLLLHRSRFFVESPFPSLLRKLASDPEIQGCRVITSASGAADGLVDADGFLVGEAQTEGEASVGLSGVVRGLGGDASSSAAATARRGQGAGTVSSHGGARLSSRVTGEVDDTRTADSGPAASRGWSGAAKARPVAPHGTDDLAELTDDELLALLESAEPATAPSASAGPAGRGPAKRRRASDAGTHPGVRTAAADSSASAKGGQAGPKRPCRDPASPGPTVCPEDSGGGRRGRVLRFEIRSDKVDVVRARCARMHPPIPLMLEYDFREDRVGVPSLAVELTRPEGLRPYQSRSLAKMFGNGRARSGMIVLPCGAGKTLVGIAAAATIKKSTIILCPNETSINQWAESFKTFTSFGRAPDAVIRRLTRGAKEPLPPLSQAVILLTTYSMMGMRNSTKAAAETVARLREIESREWGLMVLDETHQVVADTFRRVLFLSAHCRLGLTATLVREDGKDRDLVELIGPKLYEANWMDLTKGGFLANVQVTEVWCPMAPAFLKEYLTADSKDMRSVLAVMNPVKAWAAWRLLCRHMERPDDKIIVFSDSRFALERYAKAFKQPMIHGDTTMKDREAVLTAFRENAAVKVLFLSKVGDVALDVPDANVIIQISSHYGSRMQEAQRMGRILRKKKSAKSASGNHAFFYTLLSTDTEEVAWSLRRRRYLVDQGYAYKVLTAFPGLGSHDDLQRSACYMSTEKEQKDVLFHVLRQDVSAIERLETGEAARRAVSSGALANGSRLSAARFLAGNAAVRRPSSMSELAGGSGLRYVEYGADAASALVRLAASAGPVKSFRADAQKPKA